MNVMGILLKHRRQARGQIYSERVILHRILRSGGLLGLILGVHTAAMMWTEGLGLPDALWLTATTITTVGYGDLSAETGIGRILTTVLIYLVGITLLATVASDYIDLRITRRERMRLGQWRWDMKDHIVFINSPRNNGNQYFSRVVRQLREHPDYTNTGVVILTPNFPQGLPHILADLGIVHYCGTPDTDYDLDQVNVTEARHVVVLAEDEYDHRSDSHTFTVVHRLMERGVAARTLAECVLDENRERIVRQGVQNVLRPIRSYPEIVVRAITAPGTEVVLEDLFTYGGDHPRRFEIELTDVRWADIVAKLSAADIGTPMAYVDRGNQVICHPHGREHIKSKALIVIVREESIPSVRDLHRALVEFA